MDTKPQDLSRIDYPSPDPEKPYVYPGTPVLINHFRITSLDVLQRVVNTVAGLRGEQLASDPVSGNFGIEHLCAIHRFLFQDIFAWAGQPRTVDTERQGQDFVPAADIPARFRLICEELREENFLRGLGPHEFADRLAHHWYGIYAVHVFRDGNSRTMRHFFTTLAAEAGYALDFSAIDRNALLQACRHYYFADDPAPLRACMGRIIVVR